MSYTYAVDLLREKKELLERVAEALVERETLDEHEFVMLVEGKPLPPTEGPSTPPPAEPEANAEPTAEAKPASPASLAGPEAQPIA